jgi:hypothetical protein
VLVFAHGLHADLTVYRDLATAATVVAVNPAASRQALLSMADTLLDHQQRLELLAYLASVDEGAEPEQGQLLVLAARGQALAPWRPPG